MSEKDLHALSEGDRARLARTLMRRQGGLGLRVAAVFVVLVVGIPLANAYFPEAAAIKLGGFTLSWLVLGVLIYPITVALSFYFVAESNKIEAGCLDWRETLAKGDRR